MFSWECDIYLTSSTIEDFNKEQIKHDVNFINIENF